MKILAFAVAFLAASFSFVFTSAHAASTPGDASARVVTPIAVSQTTGLDFGKLTISSSGSVDESGSNASGGVTVLQAGHAAIFAVHGEPSLGYNIAVDPSTTITNGTTTLNVINITAPTTGTLNGAGDQNFNVGGTLQASGAATSGNYTGTYSVSVAY